MNTPQIEQLQMFGAPQPHIFPDSREWEFEDEPKVTEERLNDLIWQPSNLEEYRQLNLLTSTVEPSSLDRPQFSICPSCASQVIKIADGCGICGWIENESINDDQSPSAESSISIPCLVKQPKQPEVKGLILEDKGDRFTVYIPDDDSTISVSKLFVYPDFSKSVGQIEKSPRKNITPSKENPRKTRRKKGQGNGTIYCRTVTKNGKKYREAYYHYTDKGKKRTKYIPKKLLDRVKEAESLKLPVSEILILLGGDKKNPRKSSSTSLDKVEQKINDGCIEQVLETNDLNPRKSTPPSTKRCDPASSYGAKERAPRQKRKQGEGTGYIECKPIKRGGKEYKQYWYHWEEWKEGDRLTKKSRYIPKCLLARVEELEGSKVPVREILEVLGVEM